MNYHRDTEKRLGKLMADFKHVKNPSLLQFSLEEKVQSFFSCSSYNQLFFSAVVEDYQDLFTDCN